jgi:HD-GYP domain-containing protein (c-di-GMP phosphodiesterase class II)
MVPAEPGRPPPARLAEIIAALSLGVDLGFGQPMEHVLRQCLIACRLSAQVGLDEHARTDVYYTALLVNVGCHSDAYEQARWFGDDIAMKAAKYDAPLGSLRHTATTLRMVGSGNPPLHRFRIGLDFALAGRRAMDAMITGHADVARRFAEQLGLSTSVQEAVGASYEQWDGSGWPGLRAGARIPLASRLALLSEYVEVAHRVGGPDAAARLARERAGVQFDPELADAFCTARREVLEGLDATTSWSSVIASEPGLMASLTDAELDAALTAVAGFVDLKSPFTIGHAPAVAELAALAGEAAGLSPDDIGLLRRAALVHDLGRLGVSNAIWDKPGPLSEGEQERLRMYPYLTERMLRQSPSLARLGAVAAQHRERLDGSGYPRGLTGPAISMPGRLLGAADAYQSLRENRPHRPARSSADAADALQRGVRAGQLDGDAVAAVLTAAGARVPRRPTGAAGLTARELDVLRLVARGASSREIAERLVISPKTARNHIEHIYAKTGVNSRASVAMFAVQHGVLPEETYLRR